jgi:Fuc2NAc and GlcNAc transferase
VISWFAAASVAVAIAAAVAWMIARFGTVLGLTDVPNARSSHEASLPRGGGIGLILGVVGGLAALSLSGNSLARNTIVILAGAGIIAIVGLLDDLRSVPVIARLSIQSLVAVATVMVLGGLNRLPLMHPLDIQLGILALPLTALWLVAVMNFYNFMDGLDGIGGGQAIASSIGVIIAGWSLGSVQVAVVLAAASAGFLVLNRPPARVFLGDVGSTWLGFTIAALPLLAPPPDRPSAVLAVALGLSLFLLDPVETLSRLARTGQRLGVAHRLHSYQLVAFTKERYGKVAIAIVAGGLLLSIASGLAYRYRLSQLPVAVLGISIFLVERAFAWRSAKAARGSPEQTRTEGSLP